MRRYRRWSFEEKSRAVERMKSCRHEKLAAELGITKRQLYNWRRELWVKEHPWVDSSAREKALERENRGLLSSRARLRFLSQAHAATNNLVRRANLSERQPGTFCFVSPEGVTSFPAKFPQLFVNSLVAWLSCLLIED